MSGVKELLAAIRRGDLEAVGDRLTTNLDLVNARNDRGNSPLLIATYAGRPELVRLLLDRGARPTFFEACAIGLEAEVRRHLGKNPEIAREWAHDDWTGLHLAAFFGQPETAKALLDAGADVLAVSRNDEANLPINAAAAGPRADRRPDIVRLLIARGSPVDAEAHRAAILRCTRRRTTGTSRLSACSWKAAPTPLCQRVTGRSRWISLASRDGTKSSVFSAAGRAHKDADDRRRRPARRLSGRQRCS